MSSTPNSMRGLESSLQLKVVDAEGTVFKCDAEPVPPGAAGAEKQMRIPVITLELSEGGGGGMVCPQGSGSDRTPERLKVEASSNPCSGYESGDRGDATPAHSPSPRDPCTTPSPTADVVSESERGMEVQANLDPSSCRTSQEKRHSQVLSVDSATDVFLSKSSAYVIIDKEQTVPTSKSDLEAKEGQMPNESNFLEFVSLLESMNTSKVVVCNQRKERAEQSKDSGLPGGFSSKCHHCIFYCSSVTIFFTIIKLVSYCLHLMFDKGEVIQQRPSRKKEKPNKDKEAISDHITNHKNAGNNGRINNGKKEEASGTLSTPPLHGSSRGQRINPHHSSGLLELPAQETVEDLKGVIVSDEQPVAPVSSTAPGMKTESLPASEGHVRETMTTSAIPVKPVVAETCISDKEMEKGGPGQPPSCHRSEGGLVDKEAAVKRVPYLSLSQYDLLETDVSFQPWGSENSVLIAEPGNYTSIREQLHRKSPQDSLSSSCPQ
eukprot:XP_028336668.1 pecanex-like protein 2 [Physeter catodon]